LRTIPSHITTALAANDITANYIVLIAWEGVAASYPLFGIAAGSPSEFRLAYNEVTSFLTGDVADMIIKGSLGNISQEVPMISGGGQGVVSSFKLVLVNDDRDATNGRLSDVIETVEEMPLYHRDLKIYLILDTSGASAITDALLLWDGRVSGSKFDLLQYAISAKSARFTKHLVFPNQRIGQTATILTDAIVPSQNDSKTLPVVYGDFPKAIGYVDDIRTESTLRQRVNFTDATYPISTFLLIYIFGPNFGDGYIQLPTEISSPNLRQYNFWNTGEITFDKADAGDYAAEGNVYLKADADVTAAKDTDGTDGDNVFNGDLTTYALIPSVGAGQPTDTAQMKFTLPSYTIPESDARIEKLYIKVWVETDSGLMPVDLSATVKLYFLDDSGSRTMWNVLLATTGEDEKFDTYTTDNTGLEETDIAFSDTNVNAFLGSPTIGREIQIESDNDGTVTNPAIRIYALGVRIEWTQTIENTTFYADMEGVVDDVSGTITGTGSELLEKPQHIIRHIEEEFLASTINEDSGSLFSTDTVDTDKSRYYWEFAHQLVEEKKTNEIIKSLCQQSYISVFDDYQNEVKAFSLSWPQLVENNEFVSGGVDWSVGAGWSFSNGNAVAVAATGNLVTSNDIVGPLATYLVMFKIQNYTVGSVTPRLGTVSGTARSADGVFVEEITTGAGVSFTFNLLTSTFSGTIDWVRVVKQPTITIEKERIRYTKKGFPTTGQNAVVNSPISEIFTEYEVNFAWDTALDRFTENYFVKSGFTAVAATELNTTASVLSDPNGNETNSFSPSYTSGNTNAVSTDASVGSWSVKVDWVTDLFGNNYIIFSLPANLTAGNIYRLSFNYKGTVSSAIAKKCGVVNNSIIAAADYIDLLGSIIDDGVYRSYSVDVTTTIVNNGVMFWFEDAITGEVSYFDNVSLTDVTSPTGTVPAFTTNIPEIFPVGGIGTTGFAESSLIYFEACETAYTRFDSLTQKKVIDATWIQDKDVAIRLVQEMINFHTAQKKIVTIETRNDFKVGSSSYSLELEEGDVVFFDWEYIPARLVSGIDTRYFRLKKIDTILDDKNSLYQRMVFQEIGDVLLQDKFTEPEIITPSLDFSDSGNSQYLPLIGGKP